MRKDYVIGAIVILVGVFIYSKWDRPVDELLAASDDKKVVVVDDKDIPVMPAGDQVKRPTVQSTTNTPGPAVTPSSPAIAENFKNQLAKVLECVSPDKKSSLIGGVDPTFENLVQFFNESYGQYVVSLEDWVQSDIKMADGTLRRVRVDTSYMDQGSPEQRISVFGLDQSGSPKLESLDPEKSFNPTDEYISSFFTGSTLVMVEKSQRVYFPNGEELILIERNGRVESMTFTNEGRTSSCSGLDQETSSCQCN